MTVRQRSTPTMIVTLLAAAVLAGCGVVGSPAPAALPEPGTASASTTPPAPPEATPAVPSATRPAPAPARRPEAPAPAALPWPPGDPGRLQSAVDGGAQPWLLDPVEVARSYAAATHGWNDADATRQGPTTVEVRAGGGAARLTVAQPGRTGAGGIWIVTAEQRLS